MTPRELDLTQIRTRTYEEARYWVDQLEREVRRLRELLHTRETD